MALLCLSRLPLSTKVESKNELRIHDQLYPVLNRPLPLYRLETRLYLDIEVEVEVKVSPRFI